MPETAAGSSTGVTPSTGERCVATARGVVFSTVLLLQSVDRYAEGRLSTAMAALSLLAVAYIISTSLLCILGREDRGLRLPLLVVDLLLISGLIQVSQSVQSELYLLYYLPILQAGVRLTLRDTVATAVLAAMMYGLLILSNGPTGEIMTSTHVRSYAFAGSAVVMAVVLGLLKREVEKRVQREDLLARLSEEICVKAEVVGSDSRGDDQTESRAVGGPFGASLRFVAETPRSILQMIGTSLGAKHRFIYLPPKARRQGFWIVSTPKDDSSAEGARELAERLVKDDRISRQALVIEDISREPELKEFAPSVRTAMALPIRLGRRQLATVVLCDKEPTVASPEWTYSANDLRMACGLAPQAALLLDYVHVQQGVHSMLRRVVGTVAAAIDAKDADTRGHSARVACYATFLARAAGLSDDWVEAVELGALLHDVGKIGIDDALLRGVAALGPEEWDLVRQHPSIGRSIFADLEELDFLLPALDCHHERFDGTGYPRGLPGRQIPMLARVMAVADAFDAMTSPRSYRLVAMTFEEALAEIEREAGTQFDPELARLFVRYATPELVQDAWSRAIEGRHRGVEETSAPGGPTEPALAIA